MIARESALRGNNLIDIRRPMREATVAETMGCERDFGGSLLTRRLPPHEHGQRGVWGLWLDYDARIPLRLYGRTRNLVT